MSSVDEEGAAEKCEGGNYESEEDGEVLVHVLGLGYGVRDDGEVVCGDYEL